MKTPKLIEKIKNIILVVLFLSTVLLLYFLWGNLSFDQLTQTTIQSDQEIPAINQMIVPDKIIVNFGSENYTVLSAGEESIWFSNSNENSMVLAIENFVKADNILIEEITIEQYQEVMKYRSIRASFSYNLPTSDFCEIFRFKKNQCFDTIETITEIGYSSYSDRWIFVYDGKNNKYYSLVADSENSEFDALIEGIELKGYVPYYPVSSISGVDNDTLVPLSLEVNMRMIPYRQDVDVNEQDKISQLAQAFFGTNFDFVRRIKEDEGTIIYMYGYGQTVLLINTDGTIEYKEDQTLNNTGQSFTDALSAAVQFVASHGSWKSTNGTKLEPYLESVVFDPDKKKGYTFTFGLKIRDKRLYYEDGNPLEVTVTEGQVTKYKRKLVDYNALDLEQSYGDENKDVYSSVNLIAQNYVYIYSRLMTEERMKSIANEEEQFELVTSLIDDMQICYVKHNDEYHPELRPVWAVSLGTETMYFDLYSAEPVDSNEE